MRIPALVPVIGLLVSTDGKYPEKSVRRNRRLPKEKSSKEESVDGGYITVKGPGPPGPGPGYFEEHGAPPLPAEKGMGDPKMMQPPTPKPLKGEGKGQWDGSVQEYPTQHPQPEPEHISPAVTEKGKGYYYHSSSSSSSGSSSSSVKSPKSSKQSPPLMKNSHHSKSSKKKDKLPKEKKGKSIKGGKSGKGSSKSGTVHPPTPCPKTIEPSEPVVPTELPTPPPIPGECRSVFTTYVLARVPEAIAKTPERCCDFDGPTAAIITHAEPSNETSNGLEIYWDEFYQVLDWTSRKAGVCFFMTGYDPMLATGRNLTEVLINVNQVVSGISAVPAMMSTDPSPGVSVIQEIRYISENPGLPSIGVFNAGYQNIVLETILTGKKPLPYVGYLTEESYGSSAAQATLQLLGNTGPRPVCLNARVGTVPLIGRRCAAYYTGLDAQDTRPLTGISCSSSTTATQIYQYIVGNNINAAWSHGDCCVALGEAAEQVRQNGQTIVAGCMDEDIGGPSLDFVTKQPQTLQAYATSSWTNLPVIKQLRGEDGRGAQFFPSLNSLVHTAIYNKFEM